MASYIPFNGSYRVGEVEFLLRQIEWENTPVAAKEALIQSGQKHYSQMLSHENPPPRAYLDLFHAALHENRNKLAQQALLLAKGIAATRPYGVTLVSLARAGTPIGVLLKHLLHRHFDIDATHYSISIIRDIGLDANALRHILQRHAPETLVFIDGWTGKGVIARQLAESLAAFAETDGIAIAPELYVLADLSGSAAVAASTEDYLIPSCILNATVSGLVSRTVYDPGRLSPEGFHGCVFYHELAEHDLSVYFVEQLLLAAEDIGQPGLTADMPIFDRASLQQQSRRCLDWIRQHYQVTHSHLIKPGIGEATRALLRRGARCLLLQQPDDPATGHLRWLAADRGITIAVHPELPFRAVALIQELS